MKSFSDKSIAMCVYVVAMALLFTSKVEGTAKQTKTTTEYLFDITDNMRSAISLSSPDSINEKLLAPLREKTMEYHQTFMILNKTSSVYNYDDGADYFKKTG